MITLAIDSTANTATCALTKDGRMLALSTVCGLLTHSETLLPMIESMLEKTGITLVDVELFAASEGPGSFTGVRIGVSLIKGLAFGAGKPCVGVSTLEALAHNLDGMDVLAVPVMDARRSQVYTAAFCHGRHMEDSLILLSELRQRLIALAPDRPICFVGDGYDLARRYFNENPIPGATILDTPPLLIPQNALSVALLAERTYADAPDKTVFTDRTLSPRYLRASQAERERAEKLAKQ
ncbi:MAG: tRNA (adenosine(37)-N6)-threonylcarbamoyltransferase complex dimerization subunit type 1 TsaB [Clostridia bacterium]|nr:tRNA (adenosine(37)-N6)-threonylcarbamoyltransferase complex dimerization subunit type 1 TsaB [Clostridia bacterium]